MLLYYKIVIIRMRLLAKNKRKKPKKRSKLVHAPLLAFQLLTLSSAPINYYGIEFTQTMQSKPNAVSEKSSKQYAKLLRKLMNHITLNCGLKNTKKCIKPIIEISKHAVGRLSENGYDFFSECVGSWPLKNIYDLPNNANKLFALIRYSELYKDTAGWKRTALTHASSIFVSNKNAKGKSIDAILIGKIISNMANKIGNHFNLKDIYRELKIIRRLETAISATGGNLNDIESAYSFRVRHPAEFKILWSWCNIRYWNRYSEIALLETAKNMMNPKRKINSQFTVAISARSDFNSAFYHPYYSSMYDDVIDHGHHLVIFEVDSDRTLEEHINYAVLVRDKKIDNLIITGHGRENGIMLMSEAAFRNITELKTETMAYARAAQEKINIEDMIFLSDNDFGILDQIVHNLSDNANIVLISCLTGKGKYPFAKMLSEISYCEGKRITIFAPEDIAVFRGLAWNGNKIIGAKYSATTKIFRK